jgi:hypothetical protein
MVDEIKDVFISHASADKDLSKKLVSLLVNGIGVQRDQIFCTSENGTIDPGEKFTDLIKNQLRSAKVIIIFLTKNYYESKFCLCELGAAWALNQNIVPALGPEFDYNDLKAVLTGMQALKVYEKDDLNCLRDFVVKVSGSKNSNTSRWEGERDTFLRIFSSVRNDITCRVDFNDFPTLSALLNHFGFDDFKKISLLSQFKNVNDLGGFCADKEFPYQYFLRKKDRMQEEFDSFKETVNKK